MHRLMNNIVPTLPLSYDDFIIAIRGYIVKRSVSVSAVVQSCKRNR